MKKFFIFTLVGFTLTSCYRDEIDNLNADLVNERSARLNGDKVNAEAIAALETTLGDYMTETDAAISNLGDALAAETVARQEADAAITSVVDKLKVRVATNESDISDLFTEVDRVDALLLENFDTLMTAIEGNTTLINSTKVALEDAIATEAQARENGDTDLANSLGASINSLSNRVTALDDAQSDALRDSFRLLKKRLGKKQDQIDDAVADILNNNEAIDNGFTATYQLLASSLLGDVATAKSFLGAAVRRGLNYTFDSQATMTGIHGATIPAVYDLPEINRTAKGMFEINLGDIDSTVLSDIQKSRLEVVYDRAMENSDAYSRLLEAVGNFGWDVFHQIPSYNLNGNSFTYDAWYVSNLTDGEAAGDGAYVGDAVIERLLVGNVAAIRTFSFLSVAIDEGELYSKATTIVTP